MDIIGTFLAVGILWFLITWFTSSTNSSHSLNLTWIVVIGMLIVGMLTKFFLSGILGPFTVIVDIAALYFLVDKVCETSQRITVRICAWYLGLSFLISLVFKLIAS